MRFHQADQLERQHGFKLDVLPRFLLTELMHMAPLVLTIESESVGQVNHVCVNQAQVIKVKINMPDEAWRDGKDPVSKLPPKALRGSGCQEGDAPRAVLQAHP